MSYSRKSVRLVQATPILPSPIEICVAASSNEEVHAEQNATIQSLEEVPNGNKSASSPLFQHGVQFDNVDPRMVLLVYELQQEIR